MTIVRGVQKYPVSKTRSENPFFDFKNRVNYPVFQIRIFRVGYPVLKPGIRVGYGSRILENRVPGIRFEFFFSFFLNVKNEIANPKNDLMYQIS